MTARTLGFIGGGRVTRIILEGLRQSGCGLQDVVVSDVDGGALTKLKEKYPDLRISPGDNRMPAACDTVFLALHPPACLPVLDEIKGSLRPGAVLVSLAPKLTLARISEKLGGFSRLVRMIPNAPSIVGAGLFPVRLVPVRSHGPHPRQAA